VQILVATDAAGEASPPAAHPDGQLRPALNPNRIEQRFGRIHRIGQTENLPPLDLVARETREGAVYDLLLAKLEQEREALGGQVFDVLGKVTFETDPYATCY